MINKQLTNPDAVGTDDVVLFTDRELRQLRALAAELGIPTGNGHRG